MNLDERMRERLRTAAEAADDERPGLDAAATERIVAATLAEARRQKRLHSLRLYGGLGAATALAAGAMVFVAGRSNEPTPLAHAPLPRAPRCAALHELPSTRIEAEGGRHEIGERARVDAIAGTAARIETPSGCESHVTLLRGSVAVWARDLAGGQLEVDAGDARVIVHGTVFEVRASDDGSRYVAVREGRVEVRRPSEVRWLTAGQALAIPASGSASSTGLDETASARLEAVQREAPASLPTASNVAPAPTVVRNAAPTAIDPNATLRAAEAAYRAGDLAQARRLFRQVGALRGPMAEAAFIRLGRLELRAGHPAEAAQALAEHRRRFPSGALAAEARVAEAQALRATGRAAEAQALESWVVEQRPDSPQAAALRARRSP